MTLRIELSIIPFGDESKKRVIETMNVSNVTLKEGDIGIGVPDRYVVEYNSYKNYTDDTPRVSHFRSDGAIALAIKALSIIKSI